MADETYSISKFAKLTTLDRATVAKRLDGVPSSEGSKGAKTYRLEDALPALIAGQNSEMDEAKLKKVQAEAALKQHELAVEQGEYLPRKEVHDYAVRLFQSLHQRIAVQHPRQVAQQLYKADSPELIAEIMERELGRIFNELRRDHQAIL